MGLLHYILQNDNRCHCRSRKHKRYLHYRIVEDNQRKYVFGDRPCTNDPCRNRHSSNGEAFHGKNYQPQVRWAAFSTRDPKAICIGFHTTTSEAAVSTVLSEFIASKRGLLGKGVYFARSIADTIGKTQHEGGACIIAEIPIRQIFEFDKKTIYQVGKDAHRAMNLRNFVQISAWHEDYDTCYMSYEQENKDEYCIENPVKQTISWVVVIDKLKNLKVVRYDLDTEVDSTKCYRI
ncbi:unnamed protein product [Rotaria socialis]|uniref:PARP catalytic domain-containing protein n=1 Tax=Rotaria socialis TaxID=392032 RepID=A0A818IVY7_9BILA|nr:unnamed protein product [Rotaria socialis]